MVFLLSIQKAGIKNTNNIVKIRTNKNGKCMVNHVLDANGEKEGKKEGLF